MHLCHSQKFRLLNALGVVVLSKADFHTRPAKIVSFSACVCMCVTLQALNFVIHYSTKSHVSLPVLLSMAMPHSDLSECISMCARV